MDWGSKRANGKGQSLLEAMSSLEVVLLNAGSKPTFIRGEATSIVDLTFVSSSLVRGNRSSWKVTDVYTHTDHQAIVWEINGDPKQKGKHHRMNTRGWRGGMFIADLFHEALDTHPIRTGDAAAKVEEVMQRAAEAGDATMPRKEDMDRRPPVHWWSEEIAGLRKKCDRARRLAQVLKANTRTKD